MCFCFTKSQFLQLYLLFSFVPATGFRILKDLFSGIPDSYCPGFRIPKVGNRIPQVNIFWIPGFHEKIFPAIQDTGIRITLHGRTLFFYIKSGRLLTPRQTYAQIENNKQMPLNGNWRFLAKCNQPHDER